MIKEFILKQMLKRKLGNLPPHMQDKMLAAIQKDPEFFQMISKEIEAEVKRGKPEMAASIVVMKKHQARLRDLLS